MDKEKLVRVRARREATPAVDNAGYECKGTETIHFTTFMYILQNHMISTISFTNILVLYNFTRINLQSNSVIILFR